MSMSSYFVTSNGPPAAMPLDTAIVASGLPTEQLKEIFILACQGKKLEVKIAQNFISLSSKEALLCMGAQSTGYEKVASGCPDCLTAYYAIMHSEDEKVKGLNEVACEVVCND